MHKLFLYSGIFIGGGIFGWIVDTGYRSVLAGYFAPGTLIPFFSLIFATAAVVLYAFFRFSWLSFRTSIILGTIFAIILELVCGFVCDKFLHFRLWDYRDAPYNFGGYIDLLHSIYWFILTGLYRFFSRALAQQGIV